LILYLYFYFNSINHYWRLTCDLKKAFESVNHKILLSKLQFYGIRGKFRDPITSYLSDRYQRVLIASTDLSYVARSSWDTVRHGVPQGSILGPLLFLFYINDHPTVFNNSVKYVLFAHDTSLVISSYNNTQYRNYVNISFARLNDWFSSNLLTLNFNKTKHVQFVTNPRSNSKTSVSYCNNVILNSTNVKFLGIIIESLCTWKAHITQLMPKLCKACYSIW
jgi:retron-type reverse transcriptase